MRPQQVMQIFSIPAIDIIPTVDYKPIHPISLRGVSWDAWRCGVGGGACGRGANVALRTREARVAVRLHYGSLPSMAGRGQCQAGKSRWRPRLVACAVPEARPRDTNRHGGASKGVSAASGLRRSGGHAADQLPRRAFRRSASLTSGGLLDRPSRKAICGQRTGAPGRGGQRRFSPHRILTDGKGAAMGRGISASAR